MEQLQERLEQTQRDFSSQLEQQEAQKLEPIMKKVQDAINTVARAGNFVYVMDKSTALRNNVFINEALSVDVTSRIMDALSITPEDIAAGKAFVARMQQEAQQQQQQTAGQPAGTR
ncbi:MAG: OmpH family outer membrane protein [Bacteroidaceae bacterium]|nr:OmpH family outer membrane protein [Bacteroidaceae bacterium]